MVTFGTKQMGIQALIIINDKNDKYLLKLNKNNACTGHNVALSKDAKSEPFLGIIEACNILLQFVSHF